MDNYRADGHCSSASKTAFTLSSVGLLPFSKSNMLINSSLSMLNKHFSAFKLWPHSCRRSIVWRSRLPCVSVSGTCTTKFFLHLQYLLADWSEAISCIVRWQNRHQIVSVCIETAHRVWQRLGFQWTLVCSSHVDASAEFDPIVLWNDHYRVAPRCWTLHWFNYSEVQEFCCLVLDLFPKGVYLIKSFKSLTFWPIYRPFTKPVLSVWTIIRFYSFCDGSSVYFIINIGQCYRPPVTQNHQNVDLRLLV